MQTQWGWRSGGMSDGHRYVDRWRGIGHWTSVERWKGTVPWRFVMGTLALVMTLSTFLVVPAVLGGSGPASSAKWGQNLEGGPAAAADRVMGAGEADASSWSPQA